MRMQAASIDVQQYMMAAFQYRNSFPLDSEADLEEFWRLLALSVMSPLVCAATSFKTLVLVSSGSVFVLCSVGF